MKRILYFLIGVLISGCLMIPYAKAITCTDLTNFYLAIESWVQGSHPAGTYNIDYSYYETGSDANVAAQAAHSGAVGNSAYDGVSCVTNGQQYGVSYYVWEYYVRSSGITQFKVYVFGVDNVCQPDRDGDGIPDSLDAYPDTPGSYQFRIMTNYFDADGNCVGQLIVTSNGDYVLLGPLSTDQIQAGLSSGLYSSDFVNSPFWISSEDLKADGAENYYTTGDTTTKVPSSAVPIMTGAEDDLTLPVADGLNPGSTSNPSDTEILNLNKVVDNTAAMAANQQVLADYAKEQAALQRTTNSYLSSQSNHLAGIHSGVNTMVGLQAETNTKLTGIDTKIDTTNTRLLGIDAEISTTNTKLTGIDTGIGTTNTRLSRIDSGVGTTNSRLSGVQGSLTTQTTELTGIKGAIDGQASDLGEQTSHLASIKNAVNNQTSELSGIRSDLDVRATSQDTDAGSGLSEFSNTGDMWSGTMIQLTGLAAWLANLFQFQACFSVLATALTFKFVLGFFKK